MALSVTFCPVMKLAWLLEIISDNIGLMRFKITFVITLYITLQRAIGLKLEGCIGSVIFGIRVKRV